MITSYFNNAESQHIDFNGKCRILNFDDVSIAISPLPPLNIPEVPKSETKFASIDSVLEFVKVASLKITQKDVDVESGQVKGVWVQDINEPPIIAFGYIPMEGEDPATESIKDIDVSHETLIDPIFVEGESHLQTSRNNEKVADLLKEYSIYEWAQNPAKFDESKFVVYEGRTHVEYGITDGVDLTPLLELGVKHPTFYYRSKIIVPDKETIGRLLSYVLVSSLNDSFLERNYKYKKYINGAPFYKYLADFKSSKDQLLFIGKGSLVSWLSHTPSNNTEINIIHTRPLPHLKAPYYYKNTLIQNGRLMIIQNTYAGNFPSALAVSKEWVKSGVNVGYNPQEYPGGIYVEDKPNFEVYTVEGFTHKSEESSGSVYSIFGYEEGSYAALLFL